MSNPKAKRHADPMKTRTGKPRLGPLNYGQLESLLAKTSRAKDQAKIRNRMARMTPPTVCTSQVINGTNP